MAALLTDGAITAARPAAALDLVCAPPPALAGCLLHASVNTLAGGPYLLPAGLHPLLLVVLSGAIAVDQAGAPLRMPRASLCGNSRQARASSALPGTRILTVSVRAGQLGRLFDCAAIDVADGWANLDALLGGDERGELARCLAQIDAASATGAQVRAFFDFLLGLHRQRCARPSGLAPALPLLQGEPRALRLTLGLSARQFERQFLTQFGQSHRGFRRQLRVSQLLQTVVTRGAAAPAWAALAHDFGYADQAHLARDVRHYTGHTPSALSAGVARRDPAFWPYLVDPRDLQRLFGPTGY